jgi:hypothetical protein
MHTTVTRRRRGARRPHRAPYGAYGLAPACNPHASFLHVCRLHMCDTCAARMHKWVHSTPRRHRHATCLSRQSRGNMVRTSRARPRRPNTCMHSGTGTGRAPRRQHACIWAQVLTARPGGSAMMVSSTSSSVIRRHQASSGDDGELDARLRLDELTPLGEILETMISDHLLSR